MIPSHHCAPGQTMETVVIMETIGTIGHNIGFVGHTTTHHDTSFL